MFSSVICVLLADDIPVRGFIGRLEEGNFIPHVHKVLFFTHHVFNIEYNDNQVMTSLLITGALDFPWQKKKNFPRQGLAFPRRYTARKRRYFSSIILTLGHQCNFNAPFVAFFVCISATLFYAIRCYNTIGTQTEWVILTDHSPWYSLWDPNGLDDRAWYEPMTLLWLPLARARCSCVCRGIRFLASRPSAEVCDVLSSNWSVVSSLTDS